LFCVSFIILRETELYQLRMKFGIFSNVEQASRLLSASGRSAGGGKRPGRAFYFLPKHIRIWYEKGIRNFKGSLSSNFKNRNHPSRPIE
jgi:hypothetical protein